MKDAFKKKKKVKNVFVVVIYVFSFLIRRFHSLGNSGGPAFNDQGECIGVAFQVNLTLL